ncbi:MAG: PorT family protein [Bacteroidales bacterium]|nr:PorT family protein [Bacteroidales bacterium]
MLKRNQIFRAVFILLGLLYFNASWSQQSKVKNLLTFDDKPYHFGYLLGVNQMLFTIKTDQNTIGAKPALGFTIGVISDLRLGNYFNLRFIPNLQFGERVLTSWNSSTNADDEYRYSSVLLNLPLNLKIKGKRLQNMRPYILVGSSLSVDVGGNAKKDASTNTADFLLYRNDVYVDTGVGMDFYFNWFKMSTELKMSYGLSNMFLSPGTNNPRANDITGLNSKVFQFNITIE